MNTFKQFISIPFVVVGMGFLYAGYLLTRRRSDTFDTWIKDVIE